MSLPLTLLLSSTVSSPVLSGIHRTSVFFDSVHRRFALSLLCEKHCLDVVVG